MKLRAIFLMILFSVFGFHLQADRKTDSELRKMCKSLSVAFTRMKRVCEAKNNISDSTEKSNMESACGKLITGDKNTIILKNNTVLKDLQSACSEVYRKEMAKKCNADNVSKGACLFKNKACSWKEANPGSAKGSCFFPVTKSKNIGSDVNCDSGCYWE